MSRLLEMLRRRRRETPPGSADPRTPDRRTRNREVVLQALSGGAPRVPWYRTRSAAALCVLGLTGLLLYFFYLQTRSAGAVRTASGPASNAAHSRASRPVSGVPPAVAPPSAGSPAAPPVASMPDRAQPQVAPVQPPSAAPPSAEVPPVTTRLRPGSTARRPGREGGPVAPSPTHEADAGAARMDRALRYQQDGEVEKAIAEYRAILQANDSNAQAHNNLGLLYQAKGLSEPAIEEFRRAIVIDPAYAKARNNLGVAFLRTGRLDLAGSEFRRLLADDSRNQQAMVNLALVQRADGHPDQARETLIKALALDDRNAVAHYNLALLYEDIRETARALDHYEAYLKYAGAGESSQIAAVRDRCQALRQRLGADR